ncbi:MAG: hypothetical protein DCC52_05465 [Chloroflexi bacterium]|nr:MAG: hypothetical protein DCC52_05465 [Chloroflexota bacterium]
MIMLERLRAFLRTRAAQTYLVGGTVRDLLLGRAIHDVDVVVAGDASALARAFADEIGAAFYVMDESFDVARVIWDSGTTRALVDFARLRGQDIAQDLQTRDFTVNAMAADAVHWQGAAAAVIDPLNGLDDLAAKRLRAVSDEIFRNDAVRLARAVRLETELNLVADDATAALLRRDAPLLAHAPSERVRDELMRILSADNVLARSHCSDPFCPKWRRCAASRNRRRTFTMCGNIRFMPSRRQKKHNARSMRIWRTARSANNSPRILRKRHRARIRGAKCCGSHFCCTTSGNPQRARWKIRGGFGILGTKTKGSSWRVPRCGVYDSATSKFIG